MSEKAINVLLIEGDADESAVIKKSLTSTPGAGGTFEVREAPRLSTGSRLLAHERFDAILLDLSFAQRVGIEGFRKLASQAPETPVIILTGHQDESVAAQAVAEGAQDYLIKGTPECWLLKRAIRHAIERKRLSREVERLLDCDAVPKLVVDAAGGVRYVNAAAEALFGLKADTLRGRPFVYASTPDEPSRVSIAVTGSARKTVEMSAGGIAWNGAGARLISLRDVSDSGQLRLLEAEVRENMRVVEIKNKFMGRISHELRNSMATVKTAVFCLNDGLSGALTPKQSRLVEMISRNVDRQVKIIDNILDLARFQSGKLKICARPVDLSSLLDEISQEFQIKKKAQRLHVELPEGLPAVHGDPDLIVQVLRNLLENAFRFARSQVTVRAQDGGEAVALSVHDDGPGIPQEKLGELFTQFVQLDRPTGGEGYKGTGLGLAICKEIVEGHRGRIWAESPADGGSRFSFTLPKGGAAEPVSEFGAAVVREAEFYAAQGQAGPSHRLQK